MRLLRIVVAVASLALASPGALAQSNSLVGSWTLVSSVLEQGGKRIEPFGPNPKGALILDANGRYAAMIMRRDLPKIASDNRATATPEEAKTVVAGSIAHFGSYVADDKTITFRIETSTYPNWDATEQKRSFTISGDELKYVGTSAVVGGASATLTWKRAK